MNNPTKTGATMNTLTMKAKQQKIADFLATLPALAQGLGTAITPCSMAAINLALNGKLTDEIPPCASRVIGRWIIRVQDACPAEIGRDNPRWRMALPLLAGTGRDPTLEKERLAIIMDWMWTNLAQLQPLADKRGYGKEWSEMCLLRTREAAQVAKKAAADDAAAAYAAAAAAYAAAAAADAADAAAADAADAAAAYAAAYAYAYAAYAAAYAAAADAADADDAADAAAARKEFWAKADPCSLLERLVATAPAEACAIEPDEEAK